MHLDQVDNIIPVLKSSVANGGLKRSWKGLLPVRLGIRVVPASSVPSVALLNTKAEVPVATTAALLTPVAPRLHSHTSTHKTQRGHSYSLFHFAYESPYHSISSAVIFIPISCSSNTLFQNTPLLLITSGYPLSSSEHKPALVAGSRSFLTGRKGFAASGRNQKIDLHSRSQWLAEVTHRPGRATALWV